MALALPVEVPEVVLEVLQDYISVDSFFIIRSSEGASYNALVHVRLILCDSAFIE